ncbi:lysophospholipid acyltransferase family protein [Tenacibaculum soleae]|uniref:lysophospholipid acyltransferase family protein n=1 Tax=Tenacibaculum soleae TaxID=447689 RepID=UPI002300965B|nr:lysophospholipid acyltransferase family protein [Tenacibaculum soleae]
MRTFLYYLLKIYIKTGLFFYSKKTTVLGLENIPKNEAVLFTANHPNGLIDPLFIATHIKRKTHFLVRAAVFNNRFLAYFFDLLGMMPVYRIRDGIKQLSKNEEIFNQCQTILKENKTLLIFPEGSHCKDRFIRPLSKGFTRIVFGTLDNYPTTKIHIIPIGITYQNASSYPSKVTLNFGKSILANTYYDKNNIPKSAKTIKEQVTNQLENLSVHINNNEEYHASLEKLNNAQIDFTDVNRVNKIIKTTQFIKTKKRSKNYVSFLFYIVIINSIVPYLIWKLISKKITEIEFIDTFRFAINIVLFPLFYLLQSLLISYYADYKLAFIYLTTSILIVLIYTKLSTTPTSK